MLRRRVGGDINLLDEAERNGLFFLEVLSESERMSEPGADALGGKIDFLAGVVIADKADCPCGKALWSIASMSRLGKLGVNSLWRANALAVIKYRAHSAKNIGLNRDMVFSITWNSSSLADCKVHHASMS